MINYILSDTHARHEDAVVNLDESTTPRLERESRVSTRMTRLQLSGTSFFIQHEHRSDSCNKTNKNVKKRSIHAKQFYQFKNQLRLVIYRDRDCYINSILKFCQKYYGFKFIDLNLKSRVHITFSTLDY